MEQQKQKNNEKTNDILRKVVRVLQAIIRIFGSKNKTKQQ